MLVNPFFPFPGVARRLNAGSRLAPAVPVNPFPEMTDLLLYKRLGVGGIFCPTFCPAFVNELIYKILRARDLLWCTALVAYPGSLGSPGSPAETPLGGGANPWNGLAAKQLVNN